MTLENQNLDDGNNTPPKRSGLSNVITIGSTFSAGALTGYLASDYKVFERVGEVVTDQAFLGVVLISLPYALGALGFHYIGEELKKIRKSRNTIDED